MMIFRFQKRHQRRDLVKQCVGSSKELSYSGRKYAGIVSAHAFKVASIESAVSVGTPDDDKSRFEMKLEWTCRSLWTFRPEYSVGWAISSGRLPVLLVRDCRRSVKPPSNLVLG